MFFNKSATKVFLNKKKTVLDINKILYASKISKFLASHTVVRRFDFRGVDCLALFAD